MVLRESVLKGRDTEDTPEKTVWLWFYISVGVVYGEAYLVCVYSILNTLQLCRGHSKHFCICKRTTTVMRKPFNPHSLPPDFCPDVFWI